MLEELLPGDYMNLCGKAFDRYRFGKSDPIMNQRTTRDDKIIKSLDKEYHIVHGWNRDEKVSKYGGEANSLDPDKV